MKLLKKGLALILILIATHNTEAAQCRDKELEVACKTALEAADELLKQKDAKTIFLESQLKTQLSQNEQLQKDLLAKEDSIWYSNPTVTFFIGVITTGVLYETIRIRGSSH
jgi:hypothetical protein